MLKKSNAIHNICFKFSNYRNLKKTQAFLSELCVEVDLPESELIHVIREGDAKFQATWVHPYLAINLGQWLSPKFAVKVSQWVTGWQQGNAKVVKQIHLERYMLNRSKVPYTHFSMLNELMLNLIAPLEQSGYIMPPEILPDISGDTSMKYGYLCKLQNILQNETKLHCSLFKLYYCHQTKLCYNDNIYTRVRVNKIWLTVNSSYAMSNTLLLCALLKINLCLMT